MQVNRKVIEPLAKIEQDMDRLEDKIRISKLAVDQIGGLNKNVLEPKKDDIETPLERNTDSVKQSLELRTKSPKIGYRSVMMTVDKDSDNGCKFSEQPSGLSSDVKVNSI